MKKYNVFVVLIFVLSCSFFSQAANKNTIEKRLKNITQTIIQKREGYNKIRRQYLSMLNQISYTDKKINILESKIKEAKRDLYLLNKKIASLRKEVGKVSGDLRVQKKKLYNELISYYEYSKISRYYAKGVWYSYMNKFITSYMQNRIENYISKRKFLKNKVNDLAKYMEKKRRILESIKAQQNALDAQKKRLNKLADMAQRKKQQYFVEIQQLTKQRENLKQLLKRIIAEEKKREELKRKRRIYAQRINPHLVEKEFAALAHKIKPPVVGKVVGFFGRKYDPVFKVYTRNDGIDIEAKKGSCVHVIAYGRVGFVGMLPGYGGVIIVNHLNGYYTVYGGVRSYVKVGQVVRAYQCIGRLTSNKLHFEIRRHATPVNPLYFLDRRFLR